MADIDNPNDFNDCCGVKPQQILPVRKHLGHRGPLSVDISTAWYFITICAAEHAPWQVRQNGVCKTVSLDEVAPLFLNEARDNHIKNVWRLSLFLVMPDHLHFMVHIPMKPQTPSNSNGCVRGGLGQTALPVVIGQFKRLMSRRYGIMFQRDFWDTRIRDEEHSSEMFNYICNNPVRKGLCSVPRDWQYVIAFNRFTGDELPHK